MKRFWIVMLIGTLFFCPACATREVRDDFAGATAQRLATYSLDHLMEKLPQADLSRLSGKTVFLESHFVLENRDPSLAAYAKRRLELALLKQSRCRLTERPEDADRRLVVFFTSIGTDREKAGFTTPEFLLPGFAGTTRIDLLSLDMYHGISELYYYILDENNQVLAQSDKIKSVVRTDKIALPIVSIPVSNLK